MTGALGALARHVSISRLDDTYVPDLMGHRGAGFRVTNSGSLTVNLHTEVDARSLVYLEFTEGQVRGRHFHRSKVEYLCVVRGTLQAAYYLQGNEQDFATITLGEGSVVRVQPMCVHLYYAREPATALEFAQEPFTDKDVFRVEPPAAVMRALLADSGA